MSSKLIIVESPTKAKTISKFLGASYKVLSSFGHIRDLPKSKLGVDTENGFEPSYLIPADSKKHVKALKDALKGASDVYLATDEDREGEAISWHLAAALQLPLEGAKRITFHEITKRAIEEALTHPRAIDMHLVNAQQARRILDRLVGYELSPLLWKKVQRGLSAGRVQSVALRLIVDRELERRAFEKQAYWSVEGVLKKGDEPFEASLVGYDGEKIEKMTLLSQEKTDTIVEAMRTATSGQVQSIKEQTVKKQANPPFTTSTLQIEANRRLGMSAKQTMSFAQSLYETGKITYMRTDSVTLSGLFLDACSEFVTRTYGETYGNRQTFTTKSKGAQEAHEAIRPTDVTMTPESLKSALKPGEWKLYDLIWRRAVASQMSPAVLKRISIDLAIEKGTMRATGQSIDFDGFLRVYGRGTERFLPALQQGESVKLETLTAEAHETEPPARFSDATLVKNLEENGVGRPSTYASIINTLLARTYLERDDQKRFTPTPVAFIVIELLKEHFPDIVDVHFTATMEQALDEVAEGNRSWQEEISLFYRPFHKTIQEKTEQLTKTTLFEARTLGTDPVTSLPVILRTGRFGPYVQLGELEEGSTEKPRRASVPKDRVAEDLTLEQALTLLIFPRKLGTTAENEEIQVLMGRYGPYLKIGEKKNVSLPPNLDPHTITLEEALGAIAAETGPDGKKRSQVVKELGADPATGALLEIKNGRFGPYVTDGKLNASLPGTESVDTLTIERASELLARKRKNKRKT